MPPEIVVTPPLGPELTDPSAIKYCELDPPDFIKDDAVTEPVLKLFVVPSQRYRIVPSPSDKIILLLMVPKPDPLKDPIITFLLPAVPFPEPDPIYVFFMFTEFVVQHVWPALYPIIVLSAVLRYLPAS